MRLKVSNVCQVFNKEEFIATTTKGGITFTNNGDGSFTINGTATANVFIALFKQGGQLTGFNINHKYLICGNLSNTIQIFETLSVNGTRHYEDSIFTCVRSEGYLDLRITVGTTATNYVFRPQLFDLTEMYGAGNEPTTVAQFRQDFPNEMYEYSPECWKKFRRLKYVTETKNLFDIHNLTAYTPETLPKGTAGVYNGVIISRGKIDDTTCSTGKTLRQLCPDLIVGETYTLNFETTVPSSVGGQYESIHLRGSGNWWRRNRKIITESDLSAVVYIYAETDGAVYMTYNLQLEKGSTATPYQPYGYLPLNRGRYIANKEPVQLLDKSKFSATQTKQGVTYTNDGNGIITLNGTNTASYLCVFVLNVMDGKPGHKYMQLGATDDGWWNTYGLECKWIDGDGVGHGFTMRNGIMSIPSDAIVRNIYVSALVYQGYTVSNKTFKPQLFDLTEMYGAGNEPTTVAQFRQDFPNELYDYNPYNAITFR